MRDVNSYYQPRTPLDNYSRFTIYDSRLLSMCGIAGLISVNSERRVGAMLKAIEHRGRDDEGVWSSGVIDEAGRRVSFGPPRVAIIDHSSPGDPPHASADARR